MTWNDVTLKQFLEIQKVYSRDIDEFNKSKQLITILYNKDINHIPITQIDSYLKGVATLLQSPLEKGKIHKSYTINGHKYKLSSKIENLSTSQFWDFTEYSKTPTKNIHRILSCFLIPDGKEYGDGYDLDEVLEDMNFLSIADVHTISFFLLKRLGRLQKTILFYSTIQMMENMSLKEKWRMMKNLLQVFRNMDSLIMY